MASNFQKFVDYFKTHYNEDEKELIMGEFVFKELFFSNISNERQAYSHVAKMFVHYGLLIMLSKARYIISLDKIRNFDGGVAREKPA